MLQSATHATATTAAPAGKRDAMADVLKPELYGNAGAGGAATAAAAGATRRAALGLLLGTPLLSPCRGVQTPLSGAGPAAQPGPPAGPAQAPQAVGNGGTKVALILPLSG